MFFVHLSGVFVKSSGRVECRNGLGVALSGEILLLKLSTGSSWKTPWFSEQNLHNLWKFQIFLSIIIFLGGAE